MGVPNTTVAPGKRTDAAHDSEKKLWEAHTREPSDHDIVCRLVENYLSLAVMEAKYEASRVGHGIDGRELMGAAVLGLHDAVRRFSVDRKVSFPHYARIRIRGAIREELRNRDPLTRGQRATVRKIRDVAGELSAKSGRQPTHAEIAETAGMKEDEVVNYLALGSGTASLHEELEDGLQAIDLLPDDSLPSPRDETDLELLRELLQQALTELGVKDQQLLFFRYHLGLTLQEISGVFGVTPGRISQMHADIVLRLRSLMDVDKSATAAP
jgi:RNA polymerase sigma factor for flagellar operon FliA